MGASDESEPPAGERPWLVLLDVPGRDEILDHFYGQLPDRLEQLDLGGI